MTVKARKDPPGTRKPTDGPPEGQKKTPAQGQPRSTTADGPRKRAEQGAATTGVSAPLEPAVRALGMLSPQSQEMAASLIRQLAEREGVHVALTSAPGIQTPAEGIPLWVASLKAGRYAERTVQMYEYLAARYLRSDPAPTKLGVQSYLARRLEEASTAAVSNERKALASLFGFLHGEGLWPSNPLNGVKHVPGQWFSNPGPVVPAIPLGKVLWHSLFAAVHALIGTAICRQRSPLYPVVCSRRRPLALPGI